MGERTGIFWQGIRGQVPVPPAARTLGFELVDADPDAGTITTRFDGVHGFTNPYGEVLGGFLAAMLYDTLGPALLATLPAGKFMETDELNVTFIRPARAGTIVGHGRVTARMDDQAVLHAILSDSSGVLVATAHARARVVPLRESPGSRHDDPS